MTRSPQLVAGERPDILFEAFQRLEVRKGPGGVLTGEFRLEPSLGQPLLRALWRVESELAAADEALMATAAADPSVEIPVMRTSQQRLADAFVELALAVSAAVFADQAA